ncbi:tautomerase family protein (plasmid) [Rhizobium grahamii]|uniref:Tautomerase family protein n=1 Tax=Rhizobium grahamii TaxID=1120045 RepID=A0A5Q0CDX1_9HYPH|nr:MULTISPECIES: tautomerase family protein [Rhizobium]QFY63505.1 tautomerase family protein [Rhizobium grahamii]QRM51732.1 tautomerase family protein [Rhizobium sp. BG6]
MPLLKFHIYEGRSDEEIATLLDTSHAAMVRSFGVPNRDRYQLVTQHTARTMIAQDTGLGLERSPRFVLLEVVSRPRSREEKIRFYETLCLELSDRCGITAEDVMISFVQNSDDDWSFGMGRAQFVTGEL